MTPAKTADGYLCLIAECDNGRVLVLRHGMAPIWLPADRVTPARPLSQRIDDELAWRSAEQERALSARGWRQQELGW